MIRHPKAAVLDALAAAGVDAARLHDAQRTIAAAYDEANAPDPADAEIEAELTAEFLGYLGGVAPVQVEP